MQDQFALVAPGQVTAPAQVTVLFDASPADVANLWFPGGAEAQARMLAGGKISSASIVLALAIFGLILHRPGGRGRGSP